MRLSLLIPTVFAVSAVGGLANAREPVERPTRPVFVRPTIERHVPKIEILRARGEVIDRASAQRHQAPAGREVVRPTRATPSAGRLVIPQTRGDIERVRPTQGTQRPTDPRTTPAGSFKASPLLKEQIQSRVRCHESDPSCGSTAREKPIKASEGSASLMKLASPAEKFQKKIREAAEILRGKPSMLQVVCAIASVEACTKLSWAAGALEGRVEARSPHRGSMRKGAWLALLALVACSRSARAPDGRGSVPWVDPSRCLAPCSGPDPSRLARIDPLANLDPAGKFRLDAGAQPWLQKLLAAAQAAGHRAVVNWAHRPHQEQERLFLDEAEEGRFARPGHSEHELGLAVDLDHDGEEAARFLREQAPTFGFVLSYPAGKEKQTGFRPEPWHFRFVGVALARRLAASGQTLQEFLEQHPELGWWGDCGDCASRHARASCDGVDARGRCDGEVLRWCWRGSLASVDCAAAGGRCDLASLTCVGTR